MYTMSLIMAGRCCWECFKAEKEDAKRSCRLSMLDYLDSSGHSIWDNFLTGEVEEEEYNKVVEFVADISDVCNICKGEKPLVYSAVRTKWKVPLLEGIQDERAYSKKYVLSKKNLPGLKIKGNLYYGIDFARMSGKKRPRKKSN